MKSFVRSAFMTNSTNRHPTIRHFSIAKIPHILNCAGNNVILQFLYCFSTFHALVHHFSPINSTAYTHNGAKQLSMCAVPILATPTAANSIMG